jgi:hypothetical protein
MVTMPGRPNLDVTSPQEEEACYKKLEKFLDELGVCYLTSNNVLLDLEIPSPFKLYSVFINTEGVWREGAKKPFKFSILAGPQKSMRKSQKSENGYMVVNLNKLTNSFSKNQAMNCLYCCIPLSDDKMVFKPLSYLLNYHKKTIDKSPLSKKTRYNYIRIDPIVEKESETNLSLTKSFSDISRYFLKSNINDMATPSIECHNFIMTEENLKKFFLENTNYTSDFKLKFKLTKNILDKELIWPTL